ncbi:hypothetical protein BB017W439_0439 [Bifidobacterium breve]|nr:hypothetical protein [Bifidobacterium breve]AUD94758.1 hypothetical protein BB017W439_0439 [Bifidobacterium breve]EPD76765.1 hypothetical protein HMPREF1482_00550 [Bifidobacterium breve HPH0326]
MVKYNSTARSRSSRPDIRKSFRSVSKKTSAAPYPFAVYLITDHPATRTLLWKHLFVLEDLYQQPFAILQILGILLTIYFARTLIDCMRQGLFAVTVSCNRGRCLELVWNGIGKQIKHLQEE